MSQGIFYFDKFPLNIHPMTSSAFVDFKKAGFVLFDKVFKTQPLIRVTDQKALAR